MRLSGKKIAVLVESGFADYEIFYYKHRFPEEGAEVHFLSRLWGQEALTFKGQEWGATIECRESFENMDDATLRSYSAVIVPGGTVADRLRYTEDIGRLPPATEFLKRAFAEKSIVKGINCHGMWLLSLVPELVRGRRVVSHVNLLGDVRNMGAIYTDQDVVVDGDLVTGRSAGHCGPFSRRIIESLMEQP
jgi:protease I